MRSVDVVDRSLSWRKVNSCMPRPRMPPEHYDEELRALDTGASPQFPPTRATTLPTSLRFAVLSISACQSCVMQRPCCPGSLFGAPTHQQMLAQPSLAPRCFHLMGRLRQRCWLERAPRCPALHMGHLHALERHLRRQLWRRQSCSRCRRRRRCRRHQRRGRPFHHYLLGHVLLPPPHYWCRPRRATATSTHRTRIC